MECSFDLPTRNIIGEGCSGQLMTNVAATGIADQVISGLETSGIGRERSRHGLDEYLEIKALIGYN